MLSKKKKILFAASCMLYCTSAFSQAEVLTVHLCPGESAKLRAASPEAVSYEWYKDDAIITGVSGDSCMITSSGVYKVAAIGIDGCRSFSLKEVNVIEETPLALNDEAFATHDASVAIPVLINDTAFCAALDTLSVAIKAAPGKGTVSFDIYGIAHYRPRWDETGTDYFTYIVRDKEGTESNIARVDILIEGLPNIIIYPNPTTDGHVRVRVLDESVIEYKLIDVHGRVFFQRPVIDKDMTVDISHLESAHYFITFITSTRRTFTYRIIKI